MLILASASSDAIKRAAGQEDSEFQLEFGGRKGRGEGEVEEKRGEEEEGRYNLIYLQGIPMHTSSGWQGLVCCGLALTSMMQVKK